MCKLIFISLIFFRLTGIYYLQTNDKSQYSKGRAGTMEAKTSKIAYFSYSYLSSFFPWNAATNDTQEQEQENMTEE